MLPKEFAKSHPELEVMANGVAGPPGGAGGVGGFEDVGQAKTNYEKMVNDMTWLTETDENVEHDAVNSEKYIMELSKVCW